MKLVRPTSIEHAASELQQAGTELIAGGTALQLEWAAGQEKPGRLVDISRLEGLRGVDVSDDCLSIGALTPVAALATDRVVHRVAPLLSRAAADVGGPSIRQMGTLGGNIAWRKGCLLPALLALDAVIEVFDPDGKRSVALLDYLGTTDPGVLVAVRVRREPAAQWTWHKIGLRAAFTPGVIAVAGQWREEAGLIRRARFAAGSGATPPQRLTRIEAALEGSPAGSLTPEAIESAINAPTDGLRTDRYRKQAGAAALLAGLQKPGEGFAEKPRSIDTLPGERRLTRQAVGDGWHVRPDLAEKLDGHPVFPSDVRRPDMLVAKIVRAPHPHARILSIETSRAEALPGVHAVVTHRDIRGQNAFGIVIQDQPAMGFDLVRYEGDPVAAIAADTGEIAEAAAALIDVEWEPLPIVDDPIKALEPDAPQLHAEGNLRKTVSHQVGDAQKAFETAAFVVEDVYTTPRQMHGFLETEGGYAEPTPDGGLRVHVGGQCGARDRAQLSRILALPEDKIEVTTSPTGGAFGGKDELTVQPALALLALKCQRPVRIQLSRTESARAGVKRNPFWIVMKTACDSKGYLIAQQVDAIADGGAYASLSLGVIETAMEHACGPYVVPNVDARGRLVATNNGTCGAFRGFGCNEMTFAVESQIERLAKMAGIDPVAMRQRNIRTPGAPGYLGQKMAPTEHLGAMLDAAAASPLWHAPQGAAADGLTWAGTGMALCYQGNGLGTVPVDEGDVELALATDGKIEVRVGMDELGQGLIPAAQSVAATALGIDRDDVRVVFGQTAATPDSGSTTASRGTYMVWKGVEETAPGLRAALLSLAARRLNTSPSDLRLVPGGIAEGADQSGDPILRFEDLAQSVSPAQLPVELQHVTYPKTQHAGGNAHFITISGVVLIRVAVNLRTGMVRVSQIEHHTASGPVLDAASYLGQMEGAASQGLGMALTEHIEIEGGRVMNGNFDTYVMPSFADRPTRSDVFALESLDEGDVYGPRGVGELGIAGVAAAVTNAVAAALDLEPAGNWPSTLPASPETLLELARR